MQKLKFWGLRAALLAVVGIGCATVPVVKAPDWVLQPPATEEGESTVFVASGSSAEGNAVDAEKKAKADLTTQILQYIGARVTATTNAKATATLNSFQTDIEQTVNTASETRISGLRVADRFTSPQGKGVIVYLKGLYLRAELEKEKARILGVFQEQDAAVSVPEEEGDGLATAGSYFQALEKYIQAAHAASTSDIQNADIKFSRNVSKARDLLGKLSIIPLNPGQSTPVGQAFAASFDVKLVTGTGASSAGVPGAGLRFAYKVKRNNRLTVASASLKTDDQGIARFSYPVPDFAAKDVVTVVLDVGPYLEILDKVPPSYREQVNSLEDSAARNRALIPFTVVSQARTVPLVLFLTDADQDGKVLARSETAAGILEALTKEGFAKVTLGPGADPEVLKSSDDAAILEALKVLVAGTATRAAYGSFSLSEVTEGTGGRSTARAGGSLKVLNLEDGTVLFQEARQKRALGATGAAAGASALRQLGNDLGSALADQLP